MRLRRKLFWVSVLYFAEGFPFGIAYDLWPVYFRVHGVSLKEIGLMSLLFLPYTLKPAWAPLVDRFGVRQAWIFACQLALCVVTAILVGLDPSQTNWMLWLVLLAFTTFSATQDIAIDAYAVDVSTPRDVGAINGIRVSFYRAALIASGGLLLVLADIIGWRSVWLLSAALFVALGAAVLASPRVPREPSQRPEAGVGQLTGYRLLTLGAAGLLVAQAYRTDWASLWLTLAVIAGTLALVSFMSPDLLRWAISKEMLPVLAFVLLYKVGDSTLGRMVKPFWVDKGLSATEIGLISTTLGTLLTIAGALLGGWFIARHGIFRGLLWLGITQLVSNFGYVAVAALDLPRQSIYVASVVESFTQGLGTTAFLSFLMNLCDKEHAATQYALLSAAFALSRDVAGAFSGIGVEALGYPVYFTFTAFLALPALGLLPWIRSRIREDPSLGSGRGA